MHSYVLMPRLPQLSSSADETQSAFSKFVEAWQRARAAGLDPSGLAAEMRKIAGECPSEMLLDQVRALPPVYSGVGRDKTNCEGAWHLDAQPVPPQPSYVLSVEQCPTLLSAWSAAPIPVNVPQAAQRPAAAGPSWEEESRVLSCDGRVVKRFRQRAENQVLIVATFQELGWPLRIDDPLPRGSGVDPKQRLRETVRGLNVRQRQSLLAFEADGTGAGVVWHLRP